MNSEKRTSSYDREYLLKACTGIYEEAFDANACHRIMVQMLNHQRDGYHGMDCSPAFYNTVYKAMYRACLMDVARLYDVDSKSIDVRKIVNYCSRNIDKLPREISYQYETTDGTSETENTLIKVFLYDDDLTSIKGNTDLYNNVKTQIDLFEKLNIYTLPFEFYVDTNDYLTICRLRIKRYSLMIAKLKELRDKRFAHNDKSVCFDAEKLFKENAISLDEIRILIDFALDFSITISSLLTGCQKAREYFNIDDLSNTFQLVRLGKEYKNLMNKKNYSFDEV